MVTAHAHFGAWQFPFGGLTGARKTVSMPLPRKRLCLPGVPAAQPDSSDTVFYVSSSSVARPRDPRPPTSAAPGHPPPFAPQSVHLDSVTDDGRRIVREILTIPARGPPRDQEAAQHVNFASIHDIPDIDISSPGDFFRDDMDDTPSAATSELEEHARRYTNSVSTYYILKACREADFDD